MIVHSATRALLGSGTDVRLQSAPVHPTGGVEVRSLCRPLEFFHSNLGKPFLYGHHDVHRGIIML